jgi:hypothetical protein
VEASFLTKQTVLNILMGVQSLYLTTVWSGCIDYTVNKVGDCETSATSESRSRFQTQSRAATKSKQSLLEVSR